MCSVQAILDSSTDQSSKSAREKAASVKHSGASRKLFASIPTREQEEGTREERSTQSKYFNSPKLHLKNSRLHETEEKPGNYKTLEILHESSASRYDAPESHTSGLPRVS
jgi:hypothetical protein